MAFLKVRVSKAIRGQKNFENQPYDHTLMTQSFPPRSRLIYGCAAILIIIPGLFTRSRWMPRPNFVAEFGGDTLWALMVFWIVGCLFPKISTARAALIAGSFSAAIEFSQMLHPPWLDTVRANFFARLVLGQTFLWSDLVCYATGIVMGVVIERALRTRRQE